MNQNVVFLPGTLCDERIFKHLLPIFPHHTVIDLRSPVSIEAMVEAVEAAPFEKFVMIGFSMGGHIAQEFSLKHPERVEKLIVMGSSSEGYPVEERKIVESTIGLIEKSKFTGITEKRLKEYLHPHSYENLEIKQTIQAMAGADAKEVYLRQIKATLDRRDLKAQLEHLEIPVMFIAGAEDHIVPLPSIRRSAANIPLARLVVIEECGHFAPLEKPEEVKEAIREFLA